jgi:hypothetical protein
MKKGTPEISSCSKMIRRAMPDALRYVPSFYCFLMALYECSEGVMMVF